MDKEEGLLWKTGGHRGSCNVDILGYTKASIDECEYIRRRRRRRRDGTKWRKETFVIWMLPRNYGDARDVQLNYFLGIFGSELYVSFMLITILFFFRWLFQYCR